MQNSGLTFSGIPTPVLYPASPKTWYKVDGPFSLSVDIKSLLDDKNAPLSIDPGDSIFLHLNLNKLTRLLFKQGSYPDLKEGEVFSISDILVSEDKETITVIGNVLKEVV